MTVEQLIALLETMPREADVKFNCSWCRSDYCEYGPKDIQHVDCDKREPEQVIIS